MMSNRFKTEHYEVVLHAGDMEEVLPELVWHLEDLRVGQSYPNYYVARLAGKLVKVVLSGAGGDELFGGYPWRYYRGLEATDREDYMERYYGFWQRLVPDGEKSKLFTSETQRRIGMHSTFDTFRSVFDGFTGPCRNVFNSKYRDPLTYPSRWLSGPVNGARQGIDGASRDAPARAAHLADRTSSSLFGLDFGALVGGGALLTEVVFGLHGIGKLTYDSLRTSISGDHGDGHLRRVLRRRGERGRRSRLRLARPAGATCLTQRCSRCGTSTSRSGPRTASCTRSTGSRSRSGSARWSGSSASPAPERPSR